MSWALVIAVLLGGPIVAPCGGEVYGGNARPSYDMRSHGHDSGAITDDSAAFGRATANGDHGGGAEALRRFASTRTMKTGTTIAGVVFEVCVALHCTALRCPRSYLAAGGNVHDVGTTSFFRAAVVFASCVLGVSYR